MNNKKNRILIIAKNKKIYEGLFVTGGQKYSEKLIAELRSVYDGEVVILDDSDFLANGNLLKKAYIYRKNMMKFKDYDLVYFNSTHYQVALTIRRIKKLFLHTKVISEMHHLDYQSFKSFNMKHHVIKWFEKYILKNCDYIVIPNDYPAEYVVKHNYVDPKKIIRINNVFERKAHKVADGKSNQLLFVGTVEPRKGIDLLIKSLQYVEHEFILNIIGKTNKESKYWGMLQNLIKELNLEEYIHFLGRVPQEQLNKYYEQSRAFVFPSLNEGYGLSILEAMEYGLPVVAFDNTAMPYTVKNGFNGYLIKNKDVKGFAMGIEKILGLDDEKYGEMSKNAIETFNETKTDDDLKNQVREFIRLVLSEIK